MGAVITDILCECVRTTIQLRTPMWWVVALNQKIAIHKTPKKVNRLEMEEKELWQEVEI